MNNRLLNFSMSHGRHISNSNSRLHRSVSCGGDGRPISYASSWPSGPENDGNPVSLQPGYTSGPQCPFQVDDQHNYAALDISQPGYPFPNAAFGNSLAGQGHEGLQLELNHYENGSQHTYQNGDLNNNASLGMDQPQHHFPNTAFETGSMVPVYEEPQAELNLWEMNSFEASSDALGMHLSPFSNIPGMLYTNGAQLESAVPFITVPVPDAVAAPSVNDDSNRCIVCNRTFSRPQDLRRHMGKHRSPKYKCFYFDCDRTFYRNDKFRDHLRQGHKGSNPFERFSD